MKLPVAAEWKRLGLELGVPNHKLHEIQYNNRHSPEFAHGCLVDMFDWWLNNGPNREKLTFALTTIGRRDLAKQFQDNGEISQVYSYVGLVQSSLVKHSDA